MSKEMPEYVGVAEFEMHLADEGLVMIRPFGRTESGQRIPLTPFQMVLTNDMAAGLGQDLLDAAAESLSRAQGKRN